MVRGLEQRALLGGFWNGPDGMLVAWIRMVAMTVKLNGPFLAHTLKAESCGLSNLMSEEWQGADGEREERVWRDSQVQSLASQGLLVSSAEMGKIQGGWMNLVTFSLLKEKRTATGLWAIEKHGGVLHLWRVPARPPLSPHWISSADFPNHPNLCRVTALLSLILAPLSLMVHLILII